MGIFAGASGAKVLGDRRRISDYQGRHIVKVLECRAGSERSTFFGADLEVVQSGNPALTVGSKVGWATVKHLKFPEYFYSDTKKFVGIAAGEAPDSIGEPEIDRCTGDEQLIAGRYVGIEVYPKLNKEKTKTVNAVRFYATDFAG